MLRGRGIRPSERIFGERTSRFDHAWRESGVSKDRPRSSAGGLARGLSMNFVFHAESSWFPRLRAAIMISF